MLTARGMKFTMVYFQKGVNMQNEIILFETADKEIKLTVSVKNNKKTVETCKRLTGSKKYYVRVRTYKEVNGKTYYSAWSAAKTVTTKK